MTEIYEDEIIKPRKHCKGRKMAKVERWPSNSSLRNSESLRNKAKPKRGNKRRKRDHGRPGKNSAQAEYNVIPGRGRGRGKANGDSISV